MSGYSVDGNQNAAASVTILATTRGASKRHKWFYLTIGSSATPADQASNLQVNRITAPGTATAVTPTPLDSAEGAAVTTAGENHTVEPTKTAGEVLLSFSFNSRAAYQWYANPGREFVMPNTANAGAALVFVVATGTQIHEATVHFEE